MVLEQSWKEVLQEEFSKTYFHTLQEALRTEAQSAVIYPPQKDLYQALEITPFNKVKVVIIGQDPYHGANQAHGLAFSVKKGNPVPPSLKNIYKELSKDIDGFKIPNHGELTYWATQGVLLLNTTLTVSAGKPASHQKYGWENFTDEIILQLSLKKSRIIFLLWGKHAHAKAKLIDQEKHHILYAPHPSPFSAYTGFFGCKHFSKTNELLKQENLSAIDWQIPIDNNLELF